MKENSNFLKDFYSSWVDFNVNMTKSSMELMAESWKPENYENFYKVWSENMGNIMEKIMRMPGFANYSWQTFKSSAGFQKMFGEMIEMSHRNMKLPTHKDIDELSERISYLDDKLEEIEKKLDKLLAEKKETVPDKSKEEGTKKSKKKSKKGE